MLNFNAYYFSPLELIRDCYCPILKKKALVNAVLPFEESGIVNASRYRNKTIPTAGALLKEEDSPNKQISFDM